MKKYLSAFFQTFTITIFLEGIVLLLLVPATVEGSYTVFLFRMIGIAALYALFYGVGYPFVWEHLVMSRVKFVMIAAVSTVCFFFPIIFLIYMGIPSFMTPPILAVMFIVTIILHVIVLEIMSVIDNRKQVKELNQLVLAAKKEESK